MEYLNPNDPWLNTGYDPFKRMSDEQCLKMSRRTVAISLAVIAGVVIAACLLFGGCTSPRTVEYHHHHTYEADTLSLQAQVDRQMSAVRRQMDSIFSEHISQYSSQQQQSEHQQETVTETVTTTIDSLGREIRREQRTITRDITREQQQLEQRLTREYETRLRSAVDSLSSDWQLRYDALQSRLSKSDSTSSAKTPVAVRQDNRPWYRRLLEHLELIVIGAILAAGIILTRSWWKKIIG